MLSLKSWLAGKMLLPGFSENYFACFENSSCWDLRVTLERKSEEKLRERNSPERVEGMKNERSMAGGGSGGDFLSRASFPLRERRRSRLQVPRKSYDSDLECARWQRRTSWIITIKYLRKLFPPSFARPSQADKPREHLRYIVAVQTLLHPWLRLLFH